MTKKKMRIEDFLKYKKEGKKFTFVSVYDYATARIVDESKTDVILVGDSLGTNILGYEDTNSVTMEDMIVHGKGVMRGAKNTLVGIDMPYGSYEASNEQAVKSALKLISKTACEFVKIEVSINSVDRVTAIVEAGVPVIGQIGLMTQRTRVLGGHRVQGQSSDDAKKILAHALALEKAGAFALMAEAIPQGVAKKIHESVSIPLIGIGAGKFVDGQALVLHDIVGLLADFKPKFVKHFSNAYDEILKGLNAFHEETFNGDFPKEENSFNKIVEGFEI